MSEVREQAAYTAALGVQRGEIGKWIRFFQRAILFRWLRLHAAFLRVPLGVS
jgi:hypothetical protein